MKNNGKKLLAGLGVCLTLAGGSMMMTGCTGMSEEDNTKLWETVDEIKSNLSNLEENTTNLNDKVDEINDSIANLERDAIKQKGFDLYRLFIAKVETLDGDIFDNVKMTVEDLNGGSVEFITYKMKNEKMVCYSADKNFMIGLGSPDRYEVNLYYEMEDSETLCSDFVNKEVKADYFYQTHNPLGVFNDCVDSDLLKTIDCVIDCEALENGNYRLLMYEKNLSQPVMETLEITNDGYIVSLKLVSYDGKPFTMSFNFEYGVVTEKEMQEKLDIVNALPEKV